MSCPEPCLCGADDCRRCYPNSWRESCSDDGYDEDDPKHSTWAERQADAAEMRWESERDEALLQRS